MPLRYLKKEFRDDVHFSHADKHQSFGKIDINTLGMNVSCKVILSMLMGMIKQSQNPQNNKFAISLQYVEKEVRNDVHFLHAEKHQSFYKLALSFSMEVAKQVQNTRNRKLVIFLQYIKKKVF